MKKVLKWAGIALAIPLVLVALLAALLYVPPVQQWAVKQATAYASEKTGLKVEVGAVRLEFPLNLALEQFTVTDPKKALEKTDTVAHVDKLVASVDLLPLLHSEVVINELSFHRMRLNTGTFIPQARVAGTVGLLTLNSRRVALAEQLATVQRAQLSDADLLVELSDSVPPDTSTSKNKWKILTEEVLFNNTAVKVRMPGDSLRLSALLGRAAVYGGKFYLETANYVTDSIRVNEGKLTFDRPYLPRQKGFDANHIDLSGVALAVDSFYYCAPVLRLVVRRGELADKSGLALRSASAVVHLDSTRLWLPRFALTTSESSLQGDVDYPLNTFSDTFPGRLCATLHGSVGKQDIMRFLANERRPLFQRHYPNVPLRVDGVLRGNLRKLSFTGLHVDLPGAFTLHASGEARRLNEPQQLWLDSKLQVRARRVNFLLALAGTRLPEGVAIPSNIGVDGRVHLSGKQLATRFTATQGGGRLVGDARMDLAKMRYTADLSATRLPVQNFLPHRGLSPFTGSVKVNGSGTDPMAPSTSIRADARITAFHYSGYNLNRVTASGRVNNGVIHAQINSNNDLLRGTVGFDALTGKRLRATVTADVLYANLHALRLTEQSLTAALCGHVDVETDFKDLVKVKGDVTDIVVSDGKRHYRPTDMRVDITGSADTTHANVDCGDFKLRMDAADNYRRLLKHGTLLANEIAKQLEDRVIDQVRLRERLPLAKISLDTGSGNFFMSLLRKEYGVDLDSISMHLTSSPETGLNGMAAVNRLVVDSMQLDTIRLQLASDANGLTYSGQVRNGKNNPHYTFNALFNGALANGSVRLNTKVYDATNRLGIALGLAGRMENRGLRFSLEGDNPVLGYKQFKVNPDNYLFLAENRHVFADLKLTADDGTGVMIYSNNDNTEALQDITCSLNKFDLHRVLSVIPYAPDVAGILDGDFHIIQTSQDLSVSSKLSVEKLVFEQNAMGNLEAEFVYMPKADGSHYIDGILSREGTEVAKLSGIYASKGEGNIDAELTLDRTPLSYINGFIPKQIIGLKGYGEGTLTVKGSLMKPQVDGEVYLDSAYLVSVPYGVELRFDNDPVRIVNSHLLFENFAMYSHNASPLDIAGYFDFSDLSRMNLDIKMRARNYQVINARENYRSEAYGKAFVNFFGTMQGPVENLKLRGRLDVLGSTDMTYVLRDSPLTTDNQLEGLVAFTDFSDEKEEDIVRPAITGFDMDLMLNVDESAHILCALNGDKSNYVDLNGGGSLRMRYNTVDNLRLSGRYTLNNGEMKYSLPVIPLKTFTIQDGSYIQFTGDPFNPRLSITATESVKAPVSNSLGISRSVAFTCGVIISKTLKNMGLQFIIDAPEDMTLHNELQTMSVEERGKLAITMLTTGMYLADGNTSGFTLNSALSSFLQNQINNISGNALRTLDVSFGLDNTVDATGAMHTDYSFKFAKRFWNNRLRIVVGGKISSGNVDPNRDNSFFNNVSFEYRLNETANQYLRLFYERDSYDWLEGYVPQFGVGFLWKRKLNHFKDIFRFKEDNDTPPAPQPDTLKTRTR